jgi:hypothetical protein
MVELALAEINSYPYPAVLPSKNAILAQVTEELLVLMEEIQQLREEKAQCHQEIQYLKSEIAALQKSQDQSCETLALDIAMDYGSPKAHEAGESGTTAARRTG